MGVHLKKLYDLQLDGVFQTRAQGIKTFKDSQKKGKAGPPGDEAQPSVSKETQVTVNNIQ